MDNEHERLLAQATYDGHKLGHKLIREFYNRFSTNLGTVSFGTVIDVRNAWQIADLAAQRMLRSSGWDTNSDKIMVINQYDNVKFTTAENDLTQFKNIIGPMAEQLSRAEQQQAQYQAAEGLLQAQYQAAAQQLQGEWGARAEQLRVQSGDPREEVERLKNQIKTYVHANYLEDSQLKAIDRADMVAREREERARLAGDNPPRIAMPRRRQPTEKEPEPAQASNLVFTKPEIFLGPLALQQQERMRENEERARQELDAMNFAFKLGMGRKTGRRGKSPKKSPRKTRKSPKKSPRKTRKSPKKSPHKTRKSPKKSPRKTRKSPKKSPRKTRK
jgi:hypothetical protein